jgi:hypothetical protein
MKNYRAIAALLAAAGLFFWSAAPCFAQAAYSKVQGPWYQQGKLSGGIAVTNSSAATALPATGFTAWICNTGANDAFLAFGPDNTVTATTTGSSWLKSGTCGNYDLNPLTVKFTFVAALTASSTTTLTVETGLGNGPAQQSASGGAGSTVNPTTASSWGLYAQNTATSGLLGQLVMGAVTNGAPTYVSAQSSPLSLNANGGVRTEGAVNTTPTDCSGTITTGGTAQNAFTATATKHGFTILNFDTTEPMWISFTTTAAANTVASYPVPAATATTFAGAGQYTTPPGFGMNTALSVVAATTGHKWSCTWW